MQHIQVGTHTKAADVFNLKAATVIKEIVVESAMTLDILRVMMRPFSMTVEAFQLNFEKSGLDFLSLKKADSFLTFEDLKILCGEFNIILAIDFQANSLNELLDLSLYGLNLRGGEEEKVGIKSFDELDRIFDALELDE